MPFPDEPSHVAVVEYQERWPAEFRQLADQLRGALGHLAIEIDHVGSTSVPDLAAKDCIDVQVRVAALADAAIIQAMSTAGFRCRPEPWNKSEIASGSVCPKLVFAGPAAARLCNVHFRLHDGPNARFALLFRDYLRADSLARDAWGAFKTRLAASVSNLAGYGQIKAPATEVLIRAAEQWAARTGWSGTHAK